MRHTHYYDTPQLATVRVLNRAYYQPSSLKLSLARLGPPAFKLNPRLAYPA